MIELKSISKFYDSSCVVDNLSLKIESGETLVLLGASGSGKTTTLKMINRLVEPSSGEILIDGFSIDNLDPCLLRRRIGYVFQKVGLFPHMTIAQNIAVPMNLAKWSKKKTEQRTDELLELLCLDSKVKKRKPSELSGGQQQRVGVARALSIEPNIMLWDEPFGALDPIVREQLQQSALDLKRKLSLTSIFVTHDVSEAVLLADRIAVMKEGKLLQIGTPHELSSNPINDYVDQIMKTPQRQALLIDDILAEQGESANK